MQFEFARTAPDDVDLVIEGITSGDVPNDPTVAAAGFEGKQGQSLLLPGRLLVGLGDNGDGGRSAAAIASRAASRCTRVATTLPPTQAVAEGFALGAYQFAKYRSKAKPNRIASVTFVGSGAASARAAVQRGARVAEAVAVARDLVNEPGGALTPPAFADAIRAVATKAGLKVKVLDENAIAKAGYEGLLAVNRGSTYPARFVELTYEPPAARATVALVGKGITFDSGGLSIKPSDGMTTMKCDMGGAAAVVGALSAAADVGVKVRVRAFLPLTDNMLGGDAQRVGDIIRYKNGTTVEVLNTDAEGRLILADGLIAAAKEKPAAIVDLATLTGAQMVALGSKVAAVLGNHDGWVDQVRGAGERSGEPIWPLPLWADYRRDIDSTVADLKNVSGSRDAGTIIAALFLKEFVPDDVPWAHLDIAGPAWSGKEEAEITAGGTGFGVRTLLELLRTYKKP